ncbi:MAG: hypothetical protein M4579_000464 [Chaenotheca gracillima]|nr:MAG: hypothetical protein M4579_000464 [Chaenotheca gracillima]
MKSSIVALAATLLAATSSHAIDLVERSAPAVVSLDTVRRHVRDPVHRDGLRRRAKTLLETLDNEETLYFANVSLGTPPQTLRLHIDTGSSDMWMNSPDARICNVRGNPCSDSGTYNANKSSSYKFVSSDFNISYQDGSAALGDYATDTLHLGRTDIRAVQFGIGYQSSSPESILGIGYKANEVQVNRNNKPAYPNLPQAMKDAGLINSVAYSLWLNDLDASTGSILFGGVDSEKYHGELQTLPVENDVGQDSPSEFIITVTGVGLNQSGNVQAMGGSVRDDPVLLDSGSSLMYLPNDVVSDIYDAVNAEYDQQSQNAFVDCSLANDDTSLSFTFTSPTIDVSMSELIIDPGTAQDGSQITLNDGTTPACLFGIAPAGNTGAVLGDTFLRSAYVVYDLSNNQISLAQTNFNSTRSNVREIGTGKNAVPDATGVANVKTASPSQTVGGRIGGFSGSATGLGAPSATSTSTAGVAHATKVPQYAMAGLAGAGLLFAL